MIPIHKLLNRIRWDADFGDAEFLIGYHDRVQNSVLHASLKEVRFPEEAPGAFELEDGEGLAIRIPLHRVREVCRNGERIWHRPERKEGRSKRRAS